MASDLENAIKDAAMTVTKYIGDIATLTVQTRYVTIPAAGEEGAAGIDVDFDKAKPIARTVIKLDGDCDIVVPLRQAPGGPEVDTALFDLHQSNVKTAIDYRAQMVSALWGALQAGMRK